MTTILLLLPAVTALSPFATPKAWDAVSLGGPVVIKTGNTHTLFYHYRSVDDKDNKELPPLSTGRVGRAVSADGGLTFERQFDGLGAGGAVLRISGASFSAESQCLFGGTGTAPASTSAATVVSSAASRSFRTASSSWHPTVWWHADRS